MNTYIETCCKRNSNYLGPGIDDTWVLSMDMIYIIAEKNLHSLPYTTILFRKTIWTHVTKICLMNVYREAVIAMNAVSLISHQIHVVINVGGVTRREPLIGRAERQALISEICTVYPVEYKHGFIALWFVVLNHRYCYINVNNLAIFFGVASQTLGLWYDCPSLSEATLKRINMIGLYLITERQHDSTKSKMGA